MSRNISDRRFLILVAAVMALGAATLLAGYGAAGRRITRPVDGVNQSGANATPALPWSTLPMLNEAREDHGVAVSGGRLFAIGGYTRDRANAEIRLLASVEIYDPIRQVWEYGPPLPRPRAGFGAAATADGRIYVVGGYHDTDALAEVHMYDPQNGSWHERAPLPAARARLALVAGSDGLLYAIGGAQRPATVVSWIDAYDPMLDVWRREADMPGGGRFAMGAAAGADGEIMAAGGQINTDGATTDAVEIYLPASRIWRAGVPLPEPRGATQLAAIGGTWYVVGGFAGTFLVGQDLYTIIWQPRTDQPWTERTFLPDPRANFGVGVIGDVIYLVGGNGIVETDGVRGKGSLRTVSAFDVTK